MVQQSRRLSTLDRSQITLPLAYAVTFQGLFDFSLYANPGDGMVYSYHSFGELFP